MALCPARHERLWRAGKPKQENAMTTTLEQIKTRMTKVCRRFANGNDMIAEDIFQQACLYILERGWQNEKPAFIMQQVQWQAFAYHDKQLAYFKRVDSLEFIYGENETDDEDSNMPLDFVIGQGLSPEETFMRCEKVESLEQAIEGLDPKSCKIIKMLEAGNSFADIARSFGISRSAISQQMRAIRETLACVYL
jgi:RNA polymerase sigma factor (sigma-70 family)